ncbi:MAG: metallophosphoesterase [Chloroflexi bacterium]|nr:metallophosphoesterase [Chloroflexota bacterium]
MPALEAVLQACRAAACDLLVHAGDFLSSPFSPDPPSETIALLRAEALPVILGNNELYLRDWGTERWEATLAQRRRRPDSPDHFLPSIPAGQAALSAADLAWLRERPEELMLDGGRPGDVYVCHGMPGDSFSTPWDTEAAYTPAFTAEQIGAALARPGVAGADLILCGHTHQPLVLRTGLTNGRTALVIRCCGVISAGQPPAAWSCGYAVLTHRGRQFASYLDWEITLGAANYQPRDPRRP